MLNLCLPLLFALSPQAQAAPATVPVPATEVVLQAPVNAVTEAKALSFSSQKFPFKWNLLLPLGTEVDGLKVNSIFFNKRAFRSNLFKGADFGTRAQVEVTNTAKTARNPGFAVAVFDAEGRLLGVATGGTKFGQVSPGATETFDMSFHNVLERLPRGDHFFLSVELAP